MYPKVQKQYITERAGIIALQKFCANNGQIWRETETADVGIDGQIELVSEEGYATGTIIAVQSKSGASYLRRRQGGKIICSIEERHANYWENFPVPVIFTVHDPDADKTHWIDARQSIRSHHNKNRCTLKIHEENTLESTSIEDLFESTGATKNKLIHDIGDLFEHMSKRRHETNDLPVSFLELFCYGLTNLCHSLFFSMDLVMTAADTNLRLMNSEFGVGLGGPERNFIDEYIRFISQQRIANIDYSACLADWVDREMHPSFMAQLTTRGRLLVLTLQAAERKLIENKKIPPSHDGAYCAQEAFVEINKYSLSTRPIRIFNLQRALRPERYGDEPVELIRPKG